MTEIIKQVFVNLALLSLAFTIMLPFVFHILKKMVITEKGEQRDNLIWGDNKKNFNNIRVAFYKTLDAPIGYEMPDEDNIDAYSSNYPTFKDKQREKVYVDIINSAEKYVHIITPFLQVDEIMEAALINAVKRGVEIKIILAGSERQKSVYTITDLQIEKMISLGVELFEYRNGFIFTNLCTGDGDKAVVDAVDFANRETYFHMPDQEINRRNRSVKDLEEDFERTVKISVRLRNGGEWIKR
ncbi:MAG: hypothetical protein IJ232_07430 [Lachnospiraceae bacterium]|nr:hypothetical protein [Lachnospiraceae bacterium]